MASNTNPESADPPSTDKPVVWEYFGYPLESRCDPNCGQSRHHYTPDLRLYIHYLNGSLFLLSCFFCHRVGGVSVWGLSSAVPSAGHFQHIARCTFLIFHCPPASVLTPYMALHLLVDTTLHRIGSFCPIGLPTCRQPLPLVFPRRVDFLLCSAKHASTSKNHPVESKRQSSIYLSIYLYMNKCHSSDLQLI